MGGNTCSIGPVPLFLQCWFLDANTRGVPGCSFSQEKDVCLYTVLGCSQGCPTCLCHRAATLRAAGTPVATDEWDQSWDMIQKQISATRVWDKRELASWKNPHIWKPATKTPAWALKCCIYLPRWCRRAKQGGHTSAECCQVKADEHSSMTSLSGSGRLKTGETDCNT